MKQKYLAKPVVVFPALNVLRKQLQDIFFEKHGLNIFRKGWLGKDREKRSTYLRFLKRCNPRIKLAQFLDYTFLRIVDMFGCVCWLLDEVDETVLIL